MPAAEIEAAILAALPGATLDGMVTVAFSAPLADAVYLPSGTVVLPETRNSSTSLDAAKPSPTTVRVEPTVTVASPSVRSPS